MGPRELFILVDQLKNDRREFMLILDISSITTVGAAVPAPAVVVCFAGASPAGGCPR